MKKIALIMNNDTEYVRNLISGIFEYAQLHLDWNVCFFDSNIPIFNSSDEIRKKRKILNYHPDGIIACLHLDRFKIIPDNIPAVLINCRCEGTLYPFLQDDNDKIGQTAAEHMLSLGLINFAFCGFSGNETFEERLDGFKKGLSIDGIKPHIFPRPEKLDWATSEKEKKRIISWLEKLPKPVGIFAGCDRRAVQLVNICNEINLPVPDQVAVLGVDNNKMICTSSVPATSSIEIDTHHAGLEVSQLLDELIEGKKKMARQRLLTRCGKVVIRKSTDFTVAKNKHVLKAIQYIKDHITDMIQVQDVVDHCGLSRTILYKLFKKELGRSIITEMRKIKVQHICGLLEEEKLTIAEIADIFGYRDASHFARYFKTEKKMTPQDYRNSVKAR